ncbi:DUF504 domain-containing protein [Methanocella sp. CWC-04]|uniref:DUF504 domain-containing protein n=1 Tax=Methanooceanicella nereidis TaxID=2052831 RepID=A0AAP2W4P2_9EURY|nr:DUF504 domain-containing protein [Methanocella sp. CWC-04]MCD1293472.1 DUF504 domain-containing protein [Methanocella sp. CWC-04]
MVFPREILNMLKWKEGEDIRDAEIYYVHRGAPGDSKTVSGSEIVSLEKFCFELDTGSCIPYHRVYKIIYRGKPIFERYK